MHVSLSHSLVINKQSSGTHQEYNSNYHYAFPCDVYIRTSIRINSSRMKHDMMMLNFYICVITYRICTNMISASEVIRSNLVFSTHLLQFQKKGFSKCFYQKALRSRNLYNNINTHTDRQREIHPDRHTHTHTKCRIFTLLSEIFLINKNR